ncbi:low temperature requirement protein A [Yinghuangia soli]|uniref:Low temperature requirement protein A n=1 Tax=Yinghuangia soli TaxID=2908204 RepID=A0AA41PVH3_9ACTN|nr:low temperature requirement protein A [Yinghuangia soli]MCF2525654.1 low temperature requirement protein A [Yinghuangia soli]
MAREEGLVVMTGKPWSRGAALRDPNEAHRAATPLELFFDLCFVVAVAQLTARLEHAYATGHLADGIQGFLMVMFAVWWAWMNFTWFATAHDSDDVPYRLLTLLQMAGVLILASGVDAAFDGDSYRVVVAGYVVMRVALIAQWLRVARHQPTIRTRARRYAAGVGAVQVAWLILVIPDNITLFKALFLPLILCEIAVPIWAERAGAGELWHAEHIAERYGLFALIILGESVLAATVAVKDATDGGVTGSIVTVAAGGLVVAFSCWWLYFDTLGGDGPETQVRAFSWGYGHYVVFAALAAVGGGLATAAAAVAGHGDHPIPERTAALAVTVPLALFLTAVALIALRPGDPCGPDRLRKWLAAAAALVLAGVFLPPAGATAFAGGVAALLVTVETVAAHRRYRAATGTG